MTTPGVNGTGTGTGDTADAADRDRICRSALDRTLFVEAGAGTGKTTALVERICNLVVVGDVPLTDIAAITFTEAAAAELQARIRVALEDRRAEGDPLVQERCTRALADADRAAISTLHGFANRLLGEFAVAAGLPPRLRVLDEVSSQLASEERWQHFVDALYADAANEELLTRAQFLAIPIEPTLGSRASLREVADRLNESWDRLVEPLDGLDLLPLRPVRTEPLERALRDAREVQRTCTDDGDLLAEQIRVAIADGEALLRLDRDAFLRELGARRGTKAPRTDGQKKNWPDVKHAKEVCRSVHGAQLAIAAEAIDDVLHHLLVHTARYVLAAAEARRADGGLEFHDLLVLARNLLRNSDEAREALHRRYRYLLLDEFQDTDPIQIELAVLIASSVARPGDAPWSGLAVPDGSLFFVGDPKQSIYRFRRADIRLFLEARDRFGAGGALAKLTTNFRTVAPLLDWVNEFFARRMQEAPGRQPAYEPLHAHRRVESGGDHRPLLLGGCHSDEKVRAPMLREAEAGDVASTIRSILDRPDEWPVLDTRTRQWRPAVADDVTILLPTRTSLPYLRRALDAAEVPYRIATGTLVYDTQEVRDVLSVLRAIDDPGDEINLVAALRSALYACSDVDLLTYRSAGGRWDLRVDPPPGIAGDNPVVAALAHLRGLWRERWWSSPSALVSRVLRERHAFLLGFGTPRPSDVWRRLRFLVDQARAFEEAGGGDVRAFVEWASLQGADGSRVHEPLLPETEEQAVRIMTIHGSKGLEFPITVLSGLTTQVGRGRSGVSLLWDEGRLPHLKLRNSTETAEHRLRADVESEMDLDEKLRLFYVATTRARDHLVISTHHKAGETNTYAGWVHTFATSDEGRPMVRAAGTPTGPVRHPVGSLAGPPPSEAPAPTDALADRVRWVEERDRLLDPLRTPRVVSATALAGAAALADAISTDRDGDFPDDDDDLADEPSDAAYRRRGRAGTAVGNAVHGALQVLDLARPTAIAEVVRQQCSAEAIGHLAPVVEALVRSALGSGAVALAAEHPHHKELYVTAPIGGRVIEGYIDLLVETPEGLVVVDYKTDRVTTDADVDAKLERYELQAAAYAVALAAVVDRPVVACRFVFCRSSGAIERTVGDLPAAMRRIHELVDAAG